MVFFTCMVVVAILYYLQTDGLIFITIIALLAELINIFLTQTMAKSAENKVQKKYSRIVDTLKKQVQAKNKSIEELRDVHERSARVLYKANLKIKEYEGKLGVKSEDDGEIDKILEKSATRINQLGVEGKSKSTDPKKEKSSGKDKPAGKKGFNDLPPGSNRKQIPT